MKREGREIESNIKTKEFIQNNNNKSIRFNAKQHRIDYLNLNWPCYSILILFNLKKDRVVDYVDLH